LGVMGYATAVGRGVARGAWWRCLWVLLCVVVFMDCESGSGASLDAQDVSVGFWLCCYAAWFGGWVGRSVTGWHGLSDLGCWMRRLAVLPGAALVPCAG